MDNRIKNETQLERVAHETTLATGLAIAATTAWAAARVPGSGAHGLQELAVGCYGGIVGLVARRGWRYWEYLRPFPRPDHRPAGELPIWIGRDSEGRRIWAALEDLAHLLVGGQTGTGKSSFLRQMLTGWAEWCQPAALGIVVIDLKRVEFGYLRQAPHALAIVRTVREAQRALQAANAAIDERLAELERLGEVDSKGHFGRLVIVVDELAEMQTEKELMELIERIARLGRAAGVHLVLCTQRPDKTALPGSIKANIPATVAFRCRNRVNSEILLDCDAAANLPNRPGAAVWQFRHRIVVRTPWLSLANARRRMERLESRTAEGVTA